MLNFFLKERVPVAPIKNKKSKLISVQLHTLTKMTCIDFHMYERYARRLYIECNHSSLLTHRFSILFLNHIAHYSSLIIHPFNGQYHRRTTTCVNPTCFDFK